MSPAKTYGFMFVGILAGIVLDLGHAFFPKLVDQNVAFHVICVTVGAISFPAALFISLIGLSSPTTPGRLFVVPALLSLFFVIGSLGGGMSKLVSLTILDQFTQDVTQEVSSHSRTSLPQMDASDEVHRKIASNIYARDGYLTAYRVQDGKLVYYQPTEAEVSERNKALDVKKQLTQGTAEVRKSIRTNTRLVLLYFGIRASAFFLVFLIGILWIGLRRPPSVYFSS